MADVPESWIFAAHSHCPVLALVEAHWGIALHPFKKNDTPGKQKSYSANE